MVSFFTTDNDDLLLSTMTLNKDIAFRFQIDDLHRGGLGRNVSTNKIKDIFKPYLTPEHRKIDLYIVGGDCSLESKKYADELLQIFVTQIL